MRLRPWLPRQFAVPLRAALSRTFSAALSAVRALAPIRPNPRAWVFFAACWLVFSGLRSWSPPAAKIAVGLILLLATLRPDPAPTPPAK